MHSGIQIAVLSFDVIAECETSVERNLRGGRRCLISKRCGLVSRLQKANVEISGETFTAIVPFDDATEGK
jgi:hypothetical protein